MDNLAYIRARERRRRLNGRLQQCEICGERRVFALPYGSSAPRCYEHRISTLGFRTEIHHLAGLHRGVSWEMPANGHRVLSPKLERMLDPRFLAPDRSPEEEMIALAVGAVLASDHFAGQPYSPFPIMHAPRSAGSVNLQAGDFTVLRQQHPSGVNLELWIAQVSVDG